METMKIKCPNCGAILTVADSPANVGKSVKCPVCKMANPFTSFKSVKPKVTEEEDRTSLGGNLGSEDRTCLPDYQKSENIGYLWDDTAKMRYNLQEGINLIGRMTYQSVPEATVPVKTEDRGFSRKHMNIDVVKGADGVFRYYVYNAENKNPTTVNGVQLIANDKIILHNGDVIRSSSTVLILKLS